MINKYQENISRGRPNLIPLHILAIHILNSNNCMVKSEIKDIFLEWLIKEIQETGKEIDTKGVVPIVENNP